MIAKKNITNVNNEIEFFSDFSQLKLVEVLLFEKEASEWN